MSTTVTVDPTPVPDPHSREKTTPSELASFSFASTTYKLTAQYLHDPIRVPLCDGLAGVAKTHLAHAVAAGHPHPLVVGMVPFDPSESSLLYLTTDVEWQTRERKAAPGLGTGLNTGTGSGIGTNTGTGTETSSGANSGPAPELAELPELPELPALPALPDARAAAYLDQVAQAVAAIQAGNLSKVVLARRSSRMIRPVAASEIASQLESRNPVAYIFAAPTDQGVMVGASPELVVRVSGGKIESHPLAGSIGRSQDAVEAEARKTALLVSQKDLAEHAFVTDHLGASLADLTSSLHVPQQPELAETPDLWHLGTHVRGTLLPGVSCLDAVAAVHPTPAICGVPTHKAMEFIDATESEPREFYGGLVGWMDAHGNGEWALVLRCLHLDDAQADQRRTKATAVVPELVRATCYAGAGIVAGSTPAAELAETSVKLQTALAALRPFSPEPAGRENAAPENPAPDTLTTPLTSTRLTAQQGSNL